MRKLLQVVVAGLTAVSFSALAADKTEVDANTNIQSDTKAGTAGTGASTEIKTDKTGKKRAKKDKHDKSAAGSTAAPVTKDEPAPAPAPTPEKKTN